MAFVRFLAWVLLLVATIALVSDVTRLAEGGPRTLTTTYSYWKTYSPQSLASSAAFIQHTIHPAVWDPVAVRILLLPVWFLIGALGLVLAIASRRKRRVNIFAN